MKNAPINLGYFKDKADKLDVDKLVPVPVDLNKLSNVVKNNIAIKVYIMGVYIYNACI